MQPYFAVLIPDQQLGRLLRVLPVASAQLVPGYAKLAAHTNRHDAVLVIRNLDASMREYRTNARQARVQRVRSMRVENSRGGLGETVTGSEVRHSELVYHAFHEPARHRAPCYDASPEPGGPAFGLRDVDDGLHHGRDAVQGSAFLRGDGMHACDGVEGFGGVDDLAAVSEGREEPESETETVE
jgi:hypothetical protein